MTILLIKNIYNITIITMKYIIYYYITITKLLLLNYSVTISLIFNKQIRWQMLKSKKYCYDIYDFC